MSGVRNWFQTCLGIVSSGSNSASYGEAFQPRSQVSNVQTTATSSHAIKRNSGCVASTSCQAQRLPRPSSVLLPGPSCLTDAIAAIASQLSAAPSP